MLDITPKRYIPGLRLSCFALNPQSDAASHASGGAISHRRDLVLHQVNFAGVLDHLFRSEDFSPHILEG